MINKNKLKQLKKLNKKENRNRVKKNIMKGSRILSVVHKKTDGIIKLRQTTSFGNLSYASLDF